MADCVIPVVHGRTLRKDKKYLTSTVTTILIQVILQKICFVFESDENKWLNLYEHMCGFMLQFKFIDNTYKIRETPTQRNLKPIAIKMKDFFTNLQMSIVQPTVHATLVVQSLLNILWKIVEPDPDNLDIVNEIETFLGRASLIKESSAMEGLETIRDEYRRVLEHMFFIVRGGKLPTKIMCGLFSSRYYQYFDEVNEKGSGGAGQVVKAKHRLDKGFYAIKKIRFRLTTGDNFLQRFAEAEILARLEHPNIVPYKGAWIEIKFVPSLQAITDGSSDENSSSDENFLNCTQSTSDSNVIVFKDESGESEINHDSDSIEFKDDSSVPEVTHEYKNQQPQLTLEFVLFIKMSLLPMTLKDFLKDQDAPLDMKIVLDVFMQLIHGLSHVHSQRIIHHDIKPANILVRFGRNQKIDVCIADFGLACINRKGHTGEGFGTPLYAASEQRNRGTCEFKVGIFSSFKFLNELFLFRVTSTPLE